MRIYMKNPMGVSITILGQFRHFHCHMGNINATTIYNTNKWPKVLGMYWLDKIDDCEDINDLYE